MAMHKRHMMSILMRNGHLKVVGNETTEDLREALRNLRKHTLMKCHRPGLGVPIEALLPDISVIEVGPIRSRNVKTVDVKKERV